jgi:hypothetical protein
MEKVFTTMLMEVNTKVNIKMINIMVKVFTTLPMEIDTKDNIKMAK